MNLKEKRSGIIAEFNHLQSEIASKTQRSHELVGKIEMIQEMMQTEEEAKTEEK